MKKPALYGIVCILLSVILSNLAGTIPFLNLMKCLLLAYGISIIGYAVTTYKLNASNIVLYALGVIILCVYTILAMDTYLFHAMSWFPGILRYAMFSMYGIWYLVFLVPGCLIACYQKNKEA